MTNAEAIILLRGLEKSLDGYCELNENGKKAFNKAIFALEAQKKTPMNDDLISRKAAILQLSHNKCGNEEWDIAVQHDIETITQLPSAQPEYKPVKAEDFAKTMSENMLYGFMAWHGEALELIERQGFVICKKTM